MKKPKLKDLIMHEYCGEQYFIFIEDDPSKPTPPGENLIAYIRYNPAVRIPGIGRFAAKTAITRTRITTTPDWQGYLCEICKRTYEREAPRRLAQLAAKQTTQ